MDIPKMYKVKVIKQIHGCFASGSTLDIFLEKDIELPFPVFYGLRYIDRKTGFAIDFSPVEDHGNRRESETYYPEIYWEVNLQSFIVYLPSDKEIYWKQLFGESHRTVEEVAKDYLDEGWKIKNECPFVEPDSTHEEEVS